MAHVPRPLRILAKKRSLSVRRGSRTKNFRSRPRKISKEPPTQHDQQAFKRPPIRINQKGTHRIPRKRQTTPNQKKPARKNDPLLQPPHQNQRLPHHPTQTQLRPGARRNGAAAFAKRHTGYAEGRLRVVVLV